MERRETLFRSALILSFAAGTLVTLAPGQPAGNDIGARAQEVLKKNCFACHAAGRMSGLDLRNRESILKGGDRGAALTPGEPDESPLYRFAAHEEKPSMPPGKKITDEELKILREWIGAGAPLEDFSSPGSTQSTSVDPELLKLEEKPVTSEERRYWAFQKPKRVTPPSDGNPLDAFLRHAMRPRGLKPSPSVDRRTLIRRASLDLLGLPPKPEDVESFIRDRSPDAWRNVVEKLLASPHYGERWARHWLDLVRYADSEGFEFDRDRSEAWRYRDWVVKAFNSDMPYDRFIREQLAGDEYFPESHDAMIATGYLRLGPSGGGGGERGRQESLDDLVGTTSLTFLGLTVSLRSLPQSQVRSHTAERLLPDAGGFLSHSTGIASSGGC
jgi:mono/diheme cytochrome c family protein